jgi:hypothetical protein
MLLAGAAPPRQAVDDLAWLAGSWFTEEKIGWTEERWAAPRGGVMLGTSLNGRGGEARFYEFMRLAPNDSGRIGFYASPNGAPPVRFEMTSSGPQRAVFENPASDYPSRIEYSRRGNLLTATIEGPGGANRQVWRFRRTK